MPASTTVVYSQPRPESLLPNRPTGVSLHGHTLHSREGMLFIPRIAARFPALRSAIDGAAKRRGCATGMEGVDWARLYWTPPLAPRQAWDLEAAQLRALGLAPLVSLTDHDDIAAPVHLNALPELSGAVPVSVEWTFPFSGTFFHVGVHNLPPDEATAVWRRLQLATRSGSDQERVRLLAEVREMPETLIVLNHPCWDEKGCGQTHHQSALATLLRTAAGRFDALEWNGFRPRPENARALALARDVDLPVVSGGDRHGLEPNSCINVTHAASFAEFAHEVRHERRSEMVLLPHHFQRHTTRVLHHLWEILRDDPQHGLGWSRWDDRIFFTDRSGVDRPLREYWGDRPPVVVAAFIRLVHLLGHEPVRQAVRMALSLRPESGL